MSVQQRGLETRAQILQAAALCFAEQGYDATGVAEICRRAGVSKGALYHHFPTKQAIFLEILNDWLAQLDAQIEAVCTAADSAPEALLGMVTLLETVFSIASGRLPMFLQFWTKASHDPVIWGATISHYRRYQARFAALIAGGVAEGSLRPTPPMETAQVLVSMAVGVLLQGVLDPQGAAWAEVARSGMMLFLEGLRPLDSES